eukprot:scaffold71515_cov63-Phaeocystis_antarctica.AAC.3
MAPLPSSTALVVLLPFLLVVFLLDLDLLLLALRIRPRLSLLQLFVSPTYGRYRYGAGRDASQVESLERRQRAAVERSGEGGAAGVGDVGVAEVERLELRQPSRRRR